MSVSLSAAFGHSTPMHGAADFIKVARTLIWCGERQSTLRQLPPEMIAAMLTQERDANDSDRLVRRAQGPLQDGEEEVPLVPRTRAERDRFALAESQSALESWNRWVLAQDPGICDLPEGRPVATVTSLRRWTPDQALFVTADELIMVAATTRGGVFSLLPPAIAVPLTAKLDANVSEVVARAQTRWQVELRAEGLG